MKPLRNISNICAQQNSPGRKSLKDVPHKRHVLFPIKDKEIHIRKVWYSECRPRTRSSVTIWSLPETVVTRILVCLHARDLLAFKSVHPHFKNLIDSNVTLWRNISFSDSWPSEETLHHFTMAAEKKNVEASIKLAVAYLYKEGICKDGDEDVSEKSAHYFSQAESLTAKVFPFFWIFVRPPWSPDSSCSKAKTFQHIKDIARKSGNPDLAFGVGLTLKLQRLTILPGSKDDEMKFLNMAVACNSRAAAFFILLDMDLTELSLDKAKELERVRNLRMIAGSVLEAHLFLIRHYVQGHYGGLSLPMVQSYVCAWFQASKPSRIHQTFNSGHISDTSRFILVDWLVEVLTMKEYSTHTLYLAVSLVDRFLQARGIQRSKVQLLGVAAMVLSSRYLGLDILTIREAAWLTDNSYSYQDVVRMMGEIVAALSGNLRVLNVHDYVIALAPLIGETCQSAILMEYLAMLCLLQSEMGQYSPAEIASACLLLARLLLNFSDPWPVLMKNWTGFSQDYLSLCTFHIYNKCLVEGSEVDYRETKLQAVKTRYADPARCSISRIDVIPHQDLCKRLGVAKLITCGQTTKAVKFRNTDELIMSPNRGQSSVHELPSLGDFVFPASRQDRRLSATPPVDMEQEEPGSGYDGDHEDVSDESFLSKLSFSDDSDIWDSTLEDVQEDDDESFLGEEKDRGNTSFFGSISERVERFARCRFGSGNKSDKRNGIGKQRAECLSSMCQRGTKLSCVSSPVTCVANCWCVDSIRSKSTTFEASSGSVSAPEMLSSPKTRVQEPQSNSQYSDASEANNCISSTYTGSLGQIPYFKVEACIPRGTIAKPPRKTRHGKNCDNINVLDQEPHEYININTSSKSKGGKGKGKSLTRSKSLQNRLISNIDCKSYKSRFNRENDQNIPCKILSSNPSLSITLKPAPHNLCNKSYGSKNIEQHVRDSNANSVLFPCSDSSFTIKHAENLSSVSPPSSSSPSRLSSISSASYAYTPSLSSDNTYIHRPHASGGLFLSSNLTGKNIHFEQTSSSSNISRKDTSDFLSCTPIQLSCSLQHQTVAFVGFQNSFTPENSLDSFAVMPAQSNPAKCSSINDSGFIIKKAKLQAANSPGTVEVQSASSCEDAKVEPMLEMADGTHCNSSIFDGFNSVCVDSGPVLRRKRKCSENL